MFRVGLGYRYALHDELLDSAVSCLDFVEVAPENYYGLGGRWRRRLTAIRSRWPIVTHGLAMSLGGEDPLDPQLIAAAAAFTAEVQTPWHSDHLCWSTEGGRHLHELLPLVMTRASARRTAERIKSVAAELPVPYAIENVSAYLRRPEDELDEVDFLSEVVELADCKVLFDVNNLYVNAINFGADPYALLERFPTSAAIQIHLAGHLREGPLLIDTHGEPVCDPVWALFEAALARTGPVSVLLERDYHLPPLPELLREIEAIRTIGQRVFAAAARPEVRLG